MALEALQAQAGHRSIESTRIYLHLTNDWLAGEYLRAAEAIEAARLASCASTPARYACRSVRPPRVSHSSIIRPLPWIQAEHAESHTEWGGPSAPWASHRSGTLAITPTFIQI
jgi:hypothetical protein